MRPYVVRITPDSVGERVSVRVETHADPPLTDVVGRLLSWAGGVLVIERRDGSIVRVIADDLVAGRALPERRDR